MTAPATSERQYETQFIRAWERLSRSWVRKSRSGTDPGRSFYTWRHLRVIGPTAVNIATWSVPLLDSRKLWHLVTELLACDLVLTSSLFV